MLTNEEEVELVDGLHVEEHDEWVKKLYRCKCKKVSECVLGGVGAAGASVHAAVPMCPLEFRAPLGYSLTLQRYRRACGIIIQCAGYIWCWLFRSTYSRTLSRLC